jgi:hypothetical protein
MALGPRPELELDRVGFAMVVRYIIRGARPEERGSLAVESALILPLLFAAVAATVVMGVRLSDNLYLTQSTRELGVVLGRVPYMAALRATGGDAAYTISLAASGAQTTESALAQTQLAALTAGACGSAESYYSACTTAARGVTAWYARQILLMKRMMISDNITLNVQFGPPAVDPSATDGLCMLHITVTAEARAWASWALGQIVVSQSAPYVSSPVPGAGNSCLPDG